MNRERLERLLTGVRSGKTSVAAALEQLRALEHGFSIAVREAPEPFPPGVDTPEDLARVERLLGSG